MKLLFTALAFVSAGALACPADKEVQATAPEKAAVAKAPERATAGAPGAIERAPGGPEMAAALAGAASAPRGEG